MKNEGASFLLAVQFLTRLPIGFGGLYTPRRMAASVRYYPLVGILIGCVSAAVFFCADLVFPQVLAVFISMASSLLLTGAFHEDGLADTFDGIGGGLTRDKALEIMKDSRLGTYGTLALLAALALKAGALVALSPVMILFALIAGHGLSRLSSVVVISTSRYVRDHGTGKPVAERGSAITLIVASLTGGAIIAAWCFWQTPSAFAWGVAGMILGHVMMRLFFEPKLGGYTGDTLGAVQQSSEIGFYLGLVAWL
ncbi:MAG: adenosylcobinamide-GDP ribazoletransferase [Henriciella sp.]